MRNYKIKRIFKNLFYAARRKNDSSKSTVQKRKFIFVTSWNMEKAEKILIKQEQNGYRFVQSRFRYFFMFQKSAPKKVQYIFTYILPKDESPILDWHILLKSDEYRGHLMHQGYFNIFRLTKENVNLQDFYMDRLRYTRRTLIQKTLLAAFFTLISAYEITGSDLNVILRFCFILVFICGLLALISYIMGFFSTIRQKKKLMDEYER